MLIKEVISERVLSPTSITIADYVINPYKGCSFGCLYCYAKRNKNISKRKEEWGSFVDVKINLIEKLKQELQHLDKKINRVLIGSTTEAYQIIEKKYEIIRDILKICNENNIAVTILTKSNLIKRDIDILKINKKNEICFTISPVKQEFLRNFEKKSPYNDKRIDAINNLNNNGINVYAHIGPLMPGLFDIDEIFNKNNINTGRIDFEIFNYAVMDGDLIKSVYKKISDKYKIPELFELFKKVYSSEKEYNIYWKNIKKQIEKYTKKIQSKIHIHPYSGYFKNVQGQYGGK